MANRSQALPCTADSREIVAMTAVLPDAAPDNWVDRFAPARLRPWLKLGRFDRPTGIWLLMLPGWQGIALATIPSRPFASIPGPFALWLVASSYTWLLFAFFA